MQALRQALRPVTIAIALGLCAGTTVRAEEPAAPTPGVQVVGFAVTDADAGGATVRFDAELSNPTARPVGLTSLAFAVDVGGKKLVEGTLADGPEAPPGRRATISFPGRIEYKDLPALAAKTLWKRRVPFRLVVTAEVRTATATLTIPVVYDGELSTPQPPGVGLAGLRVLSWNPFDAAVEVKVGLENANAFPLPAGLLRYKVTVAGGDLSESEAALPALGPGGKAVVAIPLKVSVKRVGARVMRALKGDAAVVGLQAMASVGALAWPVELEARLPTGR